MTTTDDSNAKTGGETGKTMGEVSHTNPYTGEMAGRLFSRGPTVVTDGGKPAATDPNGRTDTESTASESTEDEVAESETMADVSHTPPKDAEDANRVFERGRKPVEDAE